MTKRIRSSLTGMIMLGVAALALGGCGPEKRIGDVNGDGRFNDQDLAALLQILTDNSIDPAPPPGPDLADVSRPCGGPADEADMRRLRAALALRQHVAGGGSDPGFVMDSQCHEGGQIGKLLPPKPAGPAALGGNLDELFEDVAAQAPAFGGAYVRDGKLLVVVTDAARFPDALAALQDAFGEQLPALPAEAVLGTYGFGQLAGWRVTGRELFYVPGVTALSVDEASNRVRVGLASASQRPLVEAAASAMGIPTAALRFDAVPAPDDQNLISDLQSTWRPIRGGLQIQNGGSCTLGLVVRRSGVPGFLTNSHCTLNRGVVDGDIFFQATGVPANRVGVEVADSAHWTQGCDANLCTNSDAAFAQIDPLVRGRRGVIFNYMATSVVVSEAPVTFDGEWLHKVGRTTGHTEGEVDDTCADVENSSGVLKYCQDRVDASSDGGDSGSPVYSGATVYSVAFHGLLWGGPSGTGDGDHFWFTPLGNIENALGNVDATNGYEKPQVTITSPTQGQDLGPGNIFNLTLQADFFDFEDGDQCTGCEVRWSSPTDGGVLGTSTVVAGQASLPVTLLWPGSRWIFATARDSMGMESTDAVLVVTSNSAPSVTIQKPVPNETITAGAYVLAGTSFDTELFSPLPCTSMQWTSAGIAGTHATGCLSFVQFPNAGTYTVLLTGTDGNGATDSDVHWVTVVPGPTTGPPNVTIKSPLIGGFDAGDTLTLRAWGDDPDDESPISYQWVLRAPTSMLGPNVPPQDILGTVGPITEVQIGLATGQDEADSTTASWQPADHLSTNCGNQVVLEIEVRAQDHQGQPADDVRSYEYMTPPC
jgi:hypothetical protein